MAGNMTPETDPDKLAVCPVYRARKACYCTAGRPEQCVVDPDDPIDDARVEDDEL